MTIRKGLISVDTNYLLGNYNIKRDLLYFDKLVYDTEELDLSSDIAKYGVKEEYYDIIKAKITDLEFLQDEGFVETINSNELEKIAKGNSIPGFKEYFQQHKGTRFFSATQVMTMESVFNTSVARTNGPPDHPYSIYRSNFVASLNKAVTGQEIIPICSDRAINTNDTNGKDFKVLQVVLNKLPIPDDSVSYEQIIDIKADEELKGKFLALRNWMIEISKSDLSSIEIEEKFDFLYNEYQRLMKRHKASIGLGSFKSFIITTLEVPEKILTLKWSDAAKSAFTILDMKTKLEELELNTPGRELAYFYELTNRLK